MHPTTQDKRAITAFLKDGTWPRPGTMPVKFSFHR